MKRGIETSVEFDPSGHCVLVIRKTKGKLTLEEIREAATEYSQNYYGLVMKCMDGDMIQYFDDDLKGDAVELYEMDDVLEVLGEIKEAMTVKELLDLHEGRLIAIDSSTGLPLFDSEEDKDAKIDRYVNGTLMAIWPSGKIGNAFSTRIDICIKCYVKHNSWKNSGTKTANEG